MESIRPIRLALLQWWKEEFSKERLLNEDRLGIFVLQIVIADAAAFLTYSRLIVSNDQISFASRVLGSYFITVTVLSLLPIFQPFRRWIECVPAHWPVSSVQRALGDVTYAILSFWSILFLGLYAPIAFVLGPYPILLSSISAVGVFTTTVCGCLIIRFLIELISRHQAIRVSLALVTVSAFGWMEHLGNSSTIYKSLPTALLIATFGQQSGNAHISHIYSPWFALAMAVVALFIYSILLKSFHWNWRELQNSLGTTGSSINLIEKIILITKWVGLSPEVRGPFSCTLTYLVRSSRYWYFVAYAPFIGFLFIHRMISASSVVTRSFGLSLCLSGTTAAFFYNSYAFDGRGVWQWFHSSVGIRGITLGRNLAMIVASLPAFLSLILLTRFLLHASHSQIAACCLLLAYLNLVHAAIGNFVSASFPKFVDLQNMWKTFMPTQSVIALLLTYLVFGAMGGAVWLASERIGVSTAVLQAPLTIMGLSFMFDC